MYDVSRKPQIVVPSVIISTRIMCDIRRKETNLIETRRCCDAKVHPVSWHRARIVVVSRWLMLMIDLAAKIADDQLFTPRRLFEKLLRHPKKQAHQSRQRHRLVQDEPGKLHFFWCGRPLVCHSTVVNKRVTFFSRF